jgi:hypothetical protein
VVSPRATLAISAAQSFLAALLLRWGLSTRPAQASGPMGAAMAVMAVASLAVAALLSPALRLSSNGTPPPGPQPAPCAGTGPTPLNTPEKQQ